jgi:hypothetical protein
MFESALCGKHSLPPKGSCLHKVKLATDGSPAAGIKVCRHRIIMHCGLHRTLVTRFWCKDVMARHSTACSPPDIPPSSTRAAAGQSLYGHSWNASPLEIVFWGKRASTGYQNLSRTSMGNWQFRVRISGEGARLTVGERSGKQGGAYQRTPELWVTSLAGTCAAQAFCKASRAAPFLAVSNEQ